MKTRIHYYDIDASTPDGKRRYAELVATIKVDGGDARGRWMKAISDESRHRQDGEVVDVEIETKYIFDNQWNATELRVFDWYEEAIFTNGRKNKTLRRGHWTEITPDMADLRRNTQRCGYCGVLYGPMHETAPEGGFCLRCLDSPYLKEEDLRLLRIAPLGFRVERAPLTAAECDILVPLYVERQSGGTDSRAKARRDKQRADVLERHGKETADAEVRRNGMLWLCDRGFDLDNVIFYDHIRRFGFGWRSPLSDSVVSRLLDIVSEFPYLYTITCADGRKLEN